MQEQLSRIFSQFVSYVTIIGGLWWFLGMPVHASAKPQDDSHTPDISLNQIQHVLIKTLALTERGLQDSTAIHQVVSERLAQAGYTPVSDVKSPHDIMVRVKCEERKTQTGPSKHRKGSHPSATASRLWKGPACHISYRLKGQPALWSWEVRTSFEDPRQAAKATGSKNTGLFALEALRSELTKDEFPLYLAAEWGQADRLIHLFQQTPDQGDRRRLILQLLGPLSSPAALSTIEEATKSPDLAVTAIEALGDQGEVAIPSLIKIVDSSENPDHRLSALKALGEIATHSTPPTLYKVFVTQLQSKDPRMQTIAVQGLGSLGDLRALAPIEALNVQAWSNPSTHVDMQNLREALNDTLYTLDASASSH